MLLLIHVLIRYLISLAKTEQTEVIYIWDSNKYIKNFLHGIYQRRCASYFKTLHHRPFTSSSQINHRYNQTWHSYSHSDGLHICQRPQHTTYIYGSPQNYQKSINCEPFTHTCVVTTMNIFLTVKNDLLSCYGAYLSCIGKKLRPCLGFHGFKSHTGLNFFKPLFSPLHN